MSKALSVLLLFCALTGFAQKPLLTTQWNQTYPYNMLCPADPLENYSHSYTGCPATAMGQIINYLRMTQDTRFDDSDDYLSSYAGRQFHIDDDWETYLFPSFPQLNVMLDSVDATLISNLQAGYPAHLAVENNTGTSGHNVVVRRIQQM